MRSSSIFLVFLALLFAAFALRGCDADPGNGDGDPAGDQHGDVPGDISGDVPGDEPVVQDDIVAFVNQDDGDAEIYVHLVDGAFVARLTDNSVDDVDPALSPLGDLCAFERAGIIYVIETDGSGTEDAITTAGDGRFPCWLDDSTVVCSLSGSMVKINILDESQTPVSAGAKDGTVDEIAVNHVTGEIVFASGGDLFRIANTGGTVTPLTSVAGTDGSPAVSPDGMKLAFERNDLTGNPSQIYIMNLPGGTPTPLTAGTSVYSFHPAFCDDGSQVIIIYEQSSATDLKKISLTGTPLGDIPILHESPELRPACPGSP